MRDWAKKTTKREKNEWNAIENGGSDLKKCFLSHSYTRFLLITLINGWNAKFLTLHPFMMTRGGGERVNITLTWVRSLLGNFPWSSRELHTSSPGFTSQPCLMNFGGLCHNYLEFLALILFSFHQFHWLGIFLRIIKIPTIKVIVV